MICEYAKEYGCVKWTCEGCDECVHPIKFECIGVQVCDLCERPVIVPLIGSHVTLTTTRNQFQLEKLDQHARYECRMFDGIIEEESICNKEMTHEVLINGLWASIMNKGAHTRNVHLVKRNWG